MIYSNLDIITRRWLIERNLPIHFYLEVLSHAATCLRELTFDTLKIVNTVDIPIDSTGSGDLPMDFQDDVSVCQPAGNALIELPKQNWINPIQINDVTTGAFTSYPDGSTDGVDTFFGFPSTWSYFYNIDDYGEGTGGRFGGHGGTLTGYKIVKQGRRVQMTGGFSDGHIVMIYVSDGQSVDNASQIDVKAIACIHAFIDWQKSPNATNEFSPEGRRFRNAKARLVTLLNPLTVTDVKNIFRRGYTLGLRN